MKRNKKRRRQRINIFPLARHDTSCDTLGMLGMLGMQEFYFWHAVDPTWSGAAGTFSDSKPGLPSLFPWKIRNDFWTLKMKP